MTSKKTKSANNNGNGKTITSQAAMNKAVKSICDVLRRDKAKGARLYVPELTWMLFLRYLDLMEQQQEQRTQALGDKPGATNQQKVIAERAAAVILAHNHPSGELKPSDSDLKIHDRLTAAGNILGITVLDHIIIARSGYYSFQEQGLIH